MHTAIPPATTEEMLESMMGLVKGADTTPPAFLTDEFEKILKNREEEKFTAVNSIYASTDKKATGRSEILDTAKECVTRDRQSTYGDLEDSFGLTAAYWSAHTGHKISASDVAVMMSLLKIARLKTSPDHMDNWVDLAGYAACGGEISLAKKG